MQPSWTVVVIVEPRVITQRDVRMPGITRNSAVVQAMACERNGPKRWTT
jgi:hypothetical protein